MLCIICVKERPASREHVFPLSIGGAFTITRVCQACNSRLGDKVDPLLVNHALIRIRRAELGLAGNSGEVPSRLAFLKGPAEMTGFGRVRVDETPDGQADVRLLPSKSEEALPEGGTIVRVQLDARDISALPVMLQREQKRRGLPPLSEADLAEAIEKAKASTQRVENPNVLYNLSIDIADYSVAMLKIAYELGHHWLGDQMLAGSDAQAMRKVLKGEVLIEDAGLIGNTPFGLEPPFNLWEAEPNSHIAFLLPVSNGCAVAVKVFNTFCAVFRVAEGFGPNLQNAPFLRNDASKRQVSEMMLWEAMAELTRASRERS